MGLAVSRLTKNVAILVRESDRQNILRIVCTIGDGLAYF